ncbi:MAG: hypothetical protein JWL59_2030 [Chthoniobacteraceae bacterium]|nr:hypothetical protein [Chthoniobacteraceae bacterium]
MNLSNIHVVLEADGFHIVDNQKEIPEGVLIEIKCETAEGWSCKQFGFERDRPTLLHPFRRSMFIYTGGKPLRVFIEGWEKSRTGGRRSQLDPGPSDNAGDFYCYPEPGDSRWSDDHLPFFLGKEFEESRVDPGFLEASPLDRFSESNDAVETLPVTLLEDEMTPADEPVCADESPMQSPEPNAY